MVGIIYDSRAFSISVLIFSFSSTAIPYDSYGSQIGSKKVD